MRQQFKATKKNPGYTLIEVLVVMVIVGIIATGVVFMFANPSARVKTQTFTVLGELNRARSEAVSKNANTWVEFIPGAAAADPDGFRTWVTGDTNISYDSGVDTLIQESYFPVDVQFYDKNVPYPDGPDIKPGGAALDVEDGVGGDDDGVVFDSGTANDNIFAFTSMGTAANSDGDALGSSGLIYMYVPVSPTAHNEVRGAPYAVEVAESTGNVRILRWATGDTWKTK